jgi:hypothetical protein
MPPSSATVRSREQRPTLCSQTGAVCFDSVVGTHTCTHTRITKHTNPRFLSLSLSRRSVTLLAVVARTHTHDDDDEDDDDDDDDAGVG